MSADGKRPACLTCRKRRVKCDLAEPTCQRCAKAKISCGGYARSKDLKFVDEKGKAQKRVQAKREAYLKNVQAEDAEVKARRISTKLDVIAESQEAETTWDILGTKTAKIKIEQPDIVPGKGLSLIAFQDQLHMSFLLSHLFVGAELFTPWMMKGCTWAEDCTTTQTMKALSGIYFGRMHRRKESLDFGFLSYSKALRLLSKDLSSPKAWELTSLTNVLAMTSFEVMASTTGQGFLNHEVGVQRLVQSSKPERFQLQPKLEIFECARLAIVYGCAERKKSCFLEEPKWKTIPWLKHPEARTSRSRMYDCWCDFPRLLEDLEDFRTGKLQPPKDSSTLCQTVYTQLGNLYKWRAQWEADNPRCCSAKPPEDIKSPFSTALHFETLDQAIELAQYNTLHLILLRAGRMLKGAEFSSLTIADTIPIIQTNPVLLLPGSEESLYDIAGEILRSVEYAMLEPHTSGGSFQIMFPLRATLEVYRPGCPERNFLMKNFTDIADKGGFEMSRGLTPAGLYGRMIEDEWPDF